MWTNSVDSTGWDSAVARLGAHPLQSAWWGAGRQSVDGIAQVFLSHGNGTLARVEIRRAGLKAAWIPKGPVYTEVSEAAEVSASLSRELRRMGFSVRFSNEYGPEGAPVRGVNRTIWIDLSRGRDAVWEGLSANWRYAVRRAARDGVAIRKASAPQDVTRFFRACEAVSRRKQFALPGSEALFRHLLAGSGAPAPVGAALYLAELSGEFAAGAFVAHSGPHLHYLWGATDRRFGRHGAGEALHWRIIEDGFAAGMTRYDLEGIDPENNPGTHDFKRRMGGDVVALPGVRGEALTLVGSLALKIFGHRHGHEQ